MSVGSIAVKSGNYSFPCLQRWGTSDHSFPTATRERHICFSILFHSSLLAWGFSSGSVGKESACASHRRCEIDFWVRKIPWRRTWQPTPGFLPGKSHGQRNLWATVHGVAKSGTQLSMTRLPFLPEKLLLTLQPPSFLTPSLTPFSFFPVEAVRPLLGSYSSMFGPLTVLLHLL